MLMEFQYFLLLLFLILFYVYGCCACMHTCAPHVCKAYEAKMRHWIPWKWNCRLLWATMWVLGTEPGSSRRAASALACWAIFPVLFSILEYFWPIVSWNYRCRTHIYGWLVSCGMHFIYIKKDIHRKVFIWSFFTWSQLSNGTYL